MISSKKDLRKYLEADMKFYYQYPLKERIILFFLKDPSYLVAKYVRLLRYEEYYFNKKSGVIGKSIYYYYLRRKNKIGNKIGFKIPRNCFDAGLTIYHHGNIIVNESARIGKNCKLHGSNCIGNNGKNFAAPLIGDELDLGFGSCIIGDVKLGNNIVVGANAVVVDDMKKNFVTLVGVPAKPIKG